MCRIQLIGVVFFMLIRISVQAEDSLQHSNAFAQYVNSVLSDSENRWKEYPKCPPLTSEILSGLQLELKSDSAKYYFEKLKPVKLDHVTYMTSMNYFEKNNDVYCLLAMIVHGNPDCRTYTMMSMFSKLSLLENKNQTVYPGSEQKLIARFLIFVFENNPKFIPGSENSTIHENYLSNMAWCLDLLTGNKQTLGKHLREWFINEKNYSRIVNQWREAINKK